MYLKKIKSKSGFTIIEVLIVLATAGLILVIIFIAVPVLQKNSRNNRRRNDLGRFYTAVEEYRLERNAAGTALFTGPSDSASFSDFKNNHLGPEFKVNYGNSNIIMADANTTPHTYKPNVDQIVYFAWHFCNEGSEHTSHSVASSSHEKHAFSVLIGMENNFYYCLDNGKG